MKLEGSATCPGCKKDHDVSFDLEKLEVKAPAAEISNASTTGTQTIQEEKPKEEPKVIEKAVSPEDTPFFACKNGNCGDLHKNPNYSKAPNKKCKNCDSLNGGKQCKNCGNKDEEEFDELDNDDLTELGIPIPESHEEHNHD